jgi:hypothetical protein
MAYTPKTARALCNADEIELVAASFPDPGATPTRARVISKLMRARRLRDKYRDLYKRQRLANRSRTGTKFGARPGSNARTQEKALLFDEVLKRFEAKLAKLDAAGRKALAAKAVAKQLAIGPAARPRAAVAKRTAVPRTGFVSERAQQANRLQRLQRIGAKKTRAHVRAQGRRNQARRDARKR